MPEAPPADKLFKEIVPAEFHDRGWVKPFLDKPYNAELGVELVKKLDGAEALIGKKTLIPGADAKPEEIDAFYGKLRPEKPEDYEFKLGEKADADLDKVLRGAAHKAGVDKRQMSAFMAELTPHFAARQKAAFEAQAALDKEFEGITTAAFGKDNEKVLARVQDALKEFTPDSLKPHIGKLDNNALALVAGVVNAVLVKYMSEDELNGKAKGEAGNQDKAALQKEARDLQASEAWRDWRHADHDKTKKRVAEIYASPAFKS